MRRYTVEPDSLVSYLDVAYYFWTALVTAKSPWPSYVVHIVLEEAVGLQDKKLNTASQTYIYIMYESQQYLFIGWRTHYT